jgi:Protein of unknown function (DUF2752)
MPISLGFACALRSVFGVPCPGCGLTRAIECCLRWDFAEAMRFHPAAPVLLLEALVAGAALAWSVRNISRRSAVWRALRLSLWPNLWGLLAVWCYRVMAHAIP